MFKRNKHKKSEDSKKTKGHHISSPHDEKDEVHDKMKNASGFLDQIDEEDTSDKDDYEKNKVQQKKLNSNEIIIEGKKKSGFSEKIKDFFANKKKRIIFISSLGVILIALVSIGMYQLTHENPTKNTLSSGSPQEASKPTLYESPLDGVMVENEAATNNHPLAIVVENHVDARPQAGLDKASIVYEALAEGGITRFMALYGENEVEKVGPVRSARTYFVDWSECYDAYLAHVGGNMDALDQIQADKIFNLDQFVYPTPYWRESGTNLATEHTMYTSTTKLRTQAQKNGYSTANHFNEYKFKDDPTDALPDSQTITIDYSNASYKVQFVYDKATNSYTRNLAGKPHVDQVSKKALTPKNVIVMTVNAVPTTTRINEPGLTMTTVGQGSAQFFVDGKQTKGTWKKESKESREMFYDENGNEMIFDRGQFWICVVPSGTRPVVE